MTTEEFEALYADSLTELNAYIGRQITQAQVLNAKNGRHHLTINKNYFHYNLVGENKFYHICKNCGAIELSNYCEPSKSQMLGNQLCFHCNHWEQIASNPPKNALIINGQLYSDGGYQKDDRRFLGHAGHEFTITQGNRTWMTNNLWSGGTIPHEFRDRLQDNAEFVK